MVAGTAGNDLHVAHLGEQFGSLRAEGLDQHVVLAQAAFQGALHHAWLLVDFLEHEVAVGTLVGSFGAFVVLHGFTLNLVALLVPDGDLVAADFGDVAFFQVHEAVGDLAQGQLVGRQEVLAQAQADDQRAATACGYQAVRLLGTDQRQAVSTMQALHRSLQGIGQVRNALQGVVDQVDDDFGIGLRSEDIAKALQLFAQFFVVLDDAVVHHGHFIAREVRVGVALGRRTVGGPASVGDAQLAGQWLDGNSGFQFTDLADTATALQFTVLGEDGQAGAVVPAVLKTLEAFDQDGCDVAFGDGTNDSTHGLLLLADRGADQVDAAGLNLFACRCGQAFVSNKGVHAAPGQLEVGDLAPYLVRFDHHDHFTGDFGHDPAQPEKFVEGGGTTTEVDAVGADEQLVEIVGAQHLLGHLALERLGMRVPGATGHQQHRLVFEVADGAGHVHRIGHHHQARMAPQFGDHGCRGATAVDDDARMFADTCHGGAGDGLFIGRHRLGRFTEQLLWHRDRATVAP
ncbi:hypothetical protein D3C79_638530 [compost metagenome]